MGLPIWRSPPPSPRPAAAALCDPAASRSAIRRRISPRTSPRDGAHRFVPSSMSRSARSTTTSSGATTMTGRRNRTTNIDTLESRSSHAVALSLSSLNSRLNDLQENAISLRYQHRQLLQAQGTRNNELEDPEDIPNDYGVPHRSSNDFSRHIPNDVTFERAVSRYHGRLLRARQAIQRLENEGLQMNEQRHRLDLLHADFDHQYRSQHSEENDRTTYYASWSNAPLRARDDSEPVPQILNGSDRFTSSPQPMVEMLSSGAVRGLSTSSGSSSSGPEMELPPLRRMGHRDVGDRSPARLRGRRSLTPPWYPDTSQYNGELRHDGLGDRERSIELDASATQDGDEENWTTMLSTIAPDERLPSASSSFASEAASRSFSAGRGSDSSRAPSSFSARTAITVPEIEDPACDNPEDVWRSIGERFDRGEDVPDEMWVDVGVPLSTARILSRARNARL